MDADGLAEKEISELKNLLPVVYSTLSMITPSLQIIHPRFWLYVFFVYLHHALP